MIPSSLCSVILPLSLAAVRLTGSDAYLTLGVLRNLRWLDCAAWYGVPGCLKLEKPPL